MKKPRISIVTPVYNAENFLPAMVKSVIAQSYTNWEMILVDDGSTDNSWWVLQELLKRYKHYPIGAARTPHEGCAHALKIAIGLATTPLCTFAGADDLLRPDSLHVIVKTFVKHPEVDFLWTRWVHTGGRPCWTKALPKGKTLKEALLNGWWGAQCQQAWRRRAYFKTTQIDPSITLAADLQIAALFASSGVRVLSIGDVTYTYRGHSEQSSHRRRREQKACAAAILVRLRQGKI